eukprot:COSAG01_NODE_19829_length_986_cov_20.973272_1_plen_204_part_10
MQPLGAEACAVCAPPQAAAAPHSLMIPSQGAQEDATAKAPIEGEVWTMSELNDGPNEDAIGKRIRVRRSVFYAEDNMTLTMAASELGVAVEHLRQLNGWITPETEGRELDLGTCIFYVHPTQEKWMEGRITAVKEWDVTIRYDSCPMDGHPDFDIGDADWYEYMSTPEAIKACWRFHAHDKGWQTAGFPECGQTVRHSSGVSGT